MAEVFKAMALGSTRREWQDGSEPVERLNGALFIDAKDHRVERRL